jgi:hypothetical protein
MGGRTVTTRRTRRRWALPGDGIIDPIAVEVAARILARGGTPYIISKRLHVSGTTAVLLAARWRSAAS